MTKAQKTFLAQADAWKANQRLSIYSCQLNIDYLEKDIINKKRMLAAERKEKKAKEKMLKDYDAHLVKVKAGYEK